MKYKCLIFDLDGTLLDSLQGILDTVNLSFKEMGFNIHRTYDEGKHFIGAGAIEFARRAMKGQNIPLDKEREVMDSDDLYFYLPDGSYVITGSNGRFTGGTISGGAATFEVLPEPASLAALALLALAAFLRRK